MNISGYTEAFSFVQQDSQTSKWCSYFKHILTGKKRRKSDEEKIEIKKVRIGFPGSVNVLDGVAGIAQQKKFIENELKNIGGYIHICDYSYSKSLLCLCQVLFVNVFVPFFCFMCYPGQKEV